MFAGDWVAVLLLAYIDYAKMFGEKPRNRVKIDPDWPNGQNIIPMKDEEKYDAKKKYNVNIDKKYR